MYNDFDDKLLLAVKVYAILTIIFWLLRFVDIIEYGLLIGLIPIIIPVVLGVVILIIMLLRMKGK